MTLAEKIVTLYPSLDGVNFMRVGIILQNDSNGKGDYIAHWDHPTYPRPTEEQLT